VERSKKPPDDLIATMTDAKGRTVWLTQKCWDHIVTEHRESRTQLESLKKTVQTADQRTKGNFPGSEKLWARDFGPSRWFTVVVAYEGRVGRVCTAIPSKKGPKEQELI
jgi:hypothetical protein